MGGFRCSYRNCKISATTTDQKIRYFHFPIKDRKRCEQWIINSQKAHFHTLPIEKLRNKVVCQYHFETKCFMNARNDRLTYCAIPTLDPSESKLSLNDVQIVPIENNDTTDFAVVTPKNECLKNPPTKSIANTLDLNKTATLDELSLIPVSRDKCTFRISSSPPTKKVKVNVKNILTPPNVKRTLITPRVVTPPVTSLEELSDNSNSNYDFATIIPMEQQPSGDITSPSNNLTYTVSENGELNLISCSQQSKIPLSLNNIKLEQLSGDSYSICIDSDTNHNNPITENETTNDFDELAEFKSEKIDFLEEEEDDEEQQLNEMESLNDDYIREITENTKHVDHITTLLTEKQTVNNKCFDLKRKRNRREIIFKHLSKEINPVLATALKMELFKKQNWDESEKHLALSLYNSTPEGYKILVDQWGFKFPPVEIVKKWMDES